MDIGRGPMRRIRNVWLVAWLPVMACEANPAAMRSTEAGLSTEAGTAHRKDGGASDAMAGTASRGADATSDAAAAPQATFAAVYAIITAGCGGGTSGCHVSGAPGKLDMPDARVAYDHLVDVASTKCVGEIRVVPGDAEASVLVRALEGTASCVKPMPLGRDPLHVEEIATIRAWIDAGAAYD